MSLNDFCFCTSCEFHNISLSSKYNPQVAEKLFSNALKIGHNEVHISTAIHLVELCGVKEKIKPKFHRTLVHLVQRFTVPLCFTHTRVIYKVYTQEENVANDSNPLSWGSFYVSPHRRAEEGIQGLWDLAITSASTWLKHLCKYGLLESVAVNGTYTKSDKR